MRARRPVAFDVRRHDRSSWWLLLVCALLLAAPSGAAPLSLQQTRSTAQVEAVFAMLQAEAPLESRAALQVLARRAGLDKLSTARLLSSFDRWSHAAQKGAASTCPTPDTSTCAPSTPKSRLERTASRQTSEAPVRTHARIRLFLE
jgi:hypothetical protein